MTKYSRLSIAALFILIASCSPKIETAIPSNMEAYNEEVEQWREERIRLLTADEGWLSLVGLYWLDQGKQTIGASRNMDIVLPSPAAGMLGQLTVEGGEVYFEAGGEAYVTSNGQRFMEGKLHTDQDEALTKLNYKSLIFYIIDRQGRLGLRLKNTLADKRFQLKTIDHFPTDPTYRLFASSDLKKQEKTVAVEDITGGVQEYEVHATLGFRLGNKKHELMAFDGGPDYYFVIFKDDTNKDNTYGGGRYLYVPRKEDEKGRVILDFNKSFNPPCVFTDFATCPIPPADNILDVSIEAGEKYPVRFGR